MPDPAITEYRNDGVAMNALAMLNNRMTGLGQQGRDKYLEHTIALDFTPLTRPDLQALYRKSKICEKVVDLLPKAATAENWLEVTVGKGRKGIPAKAVQYSEDLKLRSAVREAAIMGRLDGDGFAIVGVDDGGEPWEPVNEGRIRKLSWVYPVDRWRIIPETNTGRPGHPEWYSVYSSFTDPLPDRQITGKIHRSRVMRFPGKKLWGDMIVQNSGYNDSVLQTFFQSFVKYLIAIEYSTRMVQDYNVFTYKLQGLAQLILQGDQEKIFHRFQTILMSMSSLGGLAMDADKEDAQFITRNFSGLDTLIDRLKDDTSAAAAMPPTKLWGSSQKTALSNSSEGDKYEWADCVADYRSEVVAEPTSDFFRLVFLAQNGPTGGRLPESWGVKYRSVLRLNLKEQTALRKDQTMGVDVPSITAGVLLAEEVRESAWSGDEYTIERQLQPELWAKQQAEGEEQQQPEAGDAEGVGGAEDDPDDGLGTRTDDGGNSEAANSEALSGGTSHIEDDRSDEWDEWREDAGGTPCGKGWIKAGHKCSKGVSSQHAAANPNHAAHAAYQGALAAANGAHSHAASNQSHPDHAAYKAAHESHGGKTPIPEKASSSKSAGGNANQKKQASKRSTKTAAQAPSTANVSKPDDPIQPKSPQEYKKDAEDWLKRRIPDATYSTHDFDHAVTHHALGLSSEQIEKHVGLSKPSLGTEEVLVTMANNIFGSRAYSDAAKPKSFFADRQKVIDKYVAMAKNLSATPLQAKNNPGFKAEVDQAEPRIRSLIEASYDRMTALKQRKFGTVYKKVVKAS